MRTPLLALLLVASACKGAPPAPPLPAASASAAPRTTPVPVASAAHKAGDRRPGSADDATRHAAFAAAVGKGRGATVAKHYDEAIRAFADALAALPDSAWALSERGYAELLADHLDDAERDLVKARGLASDATLRGAISFNLGLVREKRHDAEGARAAFALSNDVHPTKAAQAKLAALGGSTSCAATEMAGAVPNDELEIANTWMEAHAIVRSDDADAELPDEAAAKRETCVTAAGPMGPPTPSDVCDGPPPWSIGTAYQSFHFHVFVVMPLTGTRLLVGNLGMIGGGPCSWSGDSSVDGVDTKLVGRVLVLDRMVTSYIWRSVGQVNDTDAPGPDAEFDCREAGKERTVTLIDLDTERTLILSSVDPASAVTVVHDAVKGNVVKLRGGGCDESYSFKK